MFSKKVIKSDKQPIDILDDKTWIIVTGAYGINIPFKNNVRQQNNDTVVYQVIPIDKKCNKDT